MPRLREAADRPARYRAVRAVLTRLRPVRAPGPPPGCRLVPGLPAQGPAGGCPAALPAVRAPGVSARGHRLVRDVLPAPPAERPATGMRAMRSGQTASGPRVVLGVLAAPPRAALRPGCSPGRPAHRPAGLAGRLHRAPGRRARPGPRLHHDHRAGAATERRASQPPAEPAGTSSLAGPLDGLPGPRPAGLLHRRGPCATDRPGRQARRRASCATWAGSWPASGASRTGR